MATPTAATFGPITLAGDGSSQYHLTGITGWDELPDARFDSTGRSNAHGEFDGPVYSAARTVTISGEVRNQAARDALLAAFDAGFVFAGASAGVPLSVTMAGKTLTALSAKVIAKQKVRAVGEWGLGRFGWQVQFRCADPLRYDALVTAGPITMPSSGGGLVFPLFITGGVLTWGTVPAPQIATVANPGSADTSVLLTISAGGSALTGGFQIVESVTGSVISYADDLPAGSTVVIDSATGSVTLNGTADRRGSLTVAQFWQVPAGATRSAVLLGLVGFSATATLTAAIRPAYW